MKQIALIKFDDSDNPWMIYKDVGMFLYELAKSNNWQGKYLYFNTTYFTKDWNEEFAKYVEPICIGEAIDGKNQKRLARNWIKKIRQRTGRSDAFQLWKYELETCQIGEENKSEYHCLL